MGQKTNPNILRLGVIKNWDSKYIEKKSSEIAFFDFKSLEIKKFLEKLFKDNKMILHCCKLSYSENNLLQIFISYYAMPEYFIKKNPLKPVKNKKLFYYKTLNSKTFKYLSNFKTRKKYKTSKSKTFKYLSDFKNLKKYKTSKFKTFKYLFNLKNLKKYKPSKFKTFKYLFNFKKIKRFEKKNKGKMQKLKTNLYKKRIKQRNNSYNKRINSFFFKKIYYNKDLITKLHKTDELNESFVRKLEKDLLDVNTKNVLNSLSERENIFCNFKKKIWNELFNRIIKNKNFFFYDSISSFFIKKSLKKICKSRRIFKGSNSFDRPISKRQSIFDALESLRSEADKSDPFIPGLEDDEIDFFGMSVNMNIIKQLVCLKFKYVTMLKNNFTYKNNWSESYKLFFKEFYLFCRALNVLKAKSNYNYRINTSRLHWIFNEKINKMKRLKKKIKILKNQKNIINKKRPLLTKTFIESLFQSLYIFLNCKLKIQVTLNQINWYSTNIKKKEAKISKWYIWLSNWLKKNSFHKDSVNICYLCVKQKNPSFLIANLIATYFKTLKRQNFFLKFIRRSLSKQLRQKYSKINGIKIKLSGRFNKWPRARHKFIKIGKGIPVLSIKTKVDYSESTSYTPNGTLGIKVWTLRKKIYYKKNFKKLFNKRIN